MIASKGKPVKVAGIAIKGQPDYQFDKGYPTQFEVYFGDLSKAKQHKVKGHFRDIKWVHLDKKSGEHFRIRKTYDVQYTSRKFTEVMFDNDVTFEGPYAIYIKPLQWSPTRTAVDYAEHMREFGASYVADIIERIDDSKPAAPKPSTKPAVSVKKKKTPSKSLPSRPGAAAAGAKSATCLLYTSPSPRD